MTSADRKKFAQIKPAEIEWRDNLPYSVDFDDIYYSLENGLAESRHVFVDGNRLIKDWSTKRQSRFVIAELGFGSGLNFLATAKAWQDLSISNPHFKQNKLHYLSIEKHPLTLKDLRKACQNWPELSELSDKLLINYPSTTYGRHQLYFDDLGITLTLLFMPVDEALKDLETESTRQPFPIEVDHWFLDGFAPSKNTDMWSESLIQLIARLSKLGTRVATFSVAASVKTPLKKYGFRIKKRKGFGRKREMLSATLAELPAKGPEPKFVNLSREAPWYNYSKIDSVPGANQLDYPELAKPKGQLPIAIIGAGIAGCSTAYSLSRYGIPLHLFDAQSEIAAGASGAAAGIFHPQLTSDMNRHSQFNWLAYQLLTRFLAGLSANDRSTFVVRRGLRRLLPKNKVHKPLFELINEFKLSPLIEIVDENLAELHFPEAGALCLKRLCEFLIEKIAPHLIELKLNTQISNIVSDDQGWTINADGKEYHYEQVIFCGGAESQLLGKFLESATQITRGQTCHLDYPKLSEALQFPVAENSYLVPQSEESVLLGSTFDTRIDLTFPKTLRQDSQSQLLSDAENLCHSLGLPFISKLDGIQPPLKGEVGYRLHAKDRMPIVGGAFNDTLLRQIYSNFGQRRFLRSENPGYNLSGLWLNTGHGSHGLLNAFVSARHLTSCIVGDISPLPYSLATAIHPARFLIRQLK